jgi:hypothetical protein
MKKIFIFLMVSVMILPLLTGCAGQSVDKNTTETLAETQTTGDVQPEPTSGTTLATTPVTTLEPEPFAPVDIFGSKFNPFYDVKFPENFNIYSAGLNIGDPKFDGIPKYVLSMTAEGKTDESITFLSKLAGIEDENSINKFLEGFNKSGFCEFKSTDDVTFTIRKTDKNDGRYQYVEGCHIDLWVDVNSSEAPRYTQLVSDNFNANALSVAADYFDVTPVFEECSIQVDLYKNSVEIRVNYDVKDVTAVQQKMVQGIKSNWYDTDNGKMGLSYGMVDFEILFDIKGGQIDVMEKTTDIQTALGDYTAPEVSLSTLGFFYAEKDGLCTYEDKKEGMQVAIYKPEWGARPITDNNWDITYLQEVNGYLVVVWYYANEQKYTIQADKGNLTAKYDYYIETGEYGNEWTPDSDTVKEHFSTVFDTQDEDVFAKAVSMFEQTLKDRFDLSLQELFALPIR